MGAFRRDLEGLRGLALAMVIGLHAELLPGGFVGVDVFFVLSGFLMTCTLMRDEQSSLLQFLSRRAWRLVPASVGVLFLVLVVSHFVLVPSVFVEVGRSAIAASAHVANIHFLLRESGYFVDAANPLLHYWSLAVEWQFYVVFPLVLPWLVHAPWMLWAAIMGLSFCSAHLVSTDAAYYLLPFRAGEFLVGTVLALQGEEQKVPRFTSVVCLAVLLLCSVMFSSALPFPGLLALVPCLATAGLIASKESDVANWGLGLLFSHLGTVSYSAYLVHYPTLFFAAKLGSWVLLVGVVLTFAMYFGVERPLRGCKRNAIPLLVLPVCAVGLFVIVVSGWATAPLSVAAKPNASNGFDSASFAVGVDCRPNIASVCMDVCAAQQRCGDRSARCIRNASQCLMSGKGGGALLLGDSHAAQHVPVFEEMGALRVFNWQFNAVPPLLFGKGFEVLKQRRMFFGGDLFFAKARDLLLPHFSVVMLGGMWNQYSRLYPEFPLLLRETVDELIRMNKTVVLLGQIPAFEGFPNSHELSGCPLWRPAASAMQDLRFKGCFGETTMGKLHTVHFPAFLNDLFRGWARKDKSGKLLYHDVNTHICRGGKCSPYFMDGLRSYVHSEHMSYGAGRLLGKRIMSQGGVPLAIQQAAKAARPIPKGFPPKDLNYFSFVE